MVEGKPVCLPTGYSKIILFPKPGSDLVANHPNGRVRLLFFYGNLYLVAFKAQGMWHKFKDLNLDIAPNYASDERKKHCKAKDIPFESNYGVRGMLATIAELKVSRETPIEMYKTLSLYDPEHHAGIVCLSDLQLMLFKSCAIFFEVIRFPIMKKRLEADGEVADRKTADREAASLDGKRRFTFLQEVAGEAADGEAASLAGKHWNR
ncbi:hypothetical protein E2562_026321 [Oryza meyeriana var. granulata]|uniref:rRNA N-glycosylase n=1 Tax=Oryza meyeriana var. granulata TaxID=110450 RepID=A0A6G1D805_9ORYZ|nr:hypothetical protein E2562_026321 [Oryza meyeriana var. granulata]